jgi:hypothetical protein
LAPAILIPVTNPIESVFATVRHRTVRTKSALSQDTARLMVFKLVMAAAKTWRRLKVKTSCPRSSRASHSRIDAECLGGLEAIGAPYPLK